MRLLRLSWKNIWFRPLPTLLSVLLLAFGTALISLLLQVSRQIEDHFTRNISGIDMVIGAKGSPLLLILSSVYHIDAPSGNISQSEYHKLLKNPMIAQGIPLAYGDNYEGFRIVGSTEDYPAHYGMTLREGRWWQNSGEVVLGAAVARSAGLQPGMKFQSRHGLQSEGEAHEHEYTVVGIMQQKGSVMDKLILTSLESVWDVHHSPEPAERTESPGAGDHEHEHNHGHEHDHHHAEAQHEAEENTEAPPREITAALIKFRNPMATMTLPRHVNQNTNMQAALPAIEVNRLFSLMGTAVIALQGLALLIIIISAISVFISLLQSLQSRQYELALLRSLGGSPAFLFRLLLWEGILIALIGYSLGFIFSKIALWGMHKLSFDRSGYPLDIWQFQPKELWIPAGVILLGIFAALIPAWRAYRLNISKALSDA